MSNPAQLSPMVVAIDLMRINIDALQLDDLEAHAEQVLNTIAALNSYINSPHIKSSNALHNAIRLVRKLILHMARVRDLLNAHAAVAAMTATVSASGTANLPHGAVRPNP